LKKKRLLLRLWLLPHLLRVLHLLRALLLRLLPLLLQQKRSNDFVFSFV
jgi:hypothetical protein